MFILYFVLVVTFVASFQQNPNVRMPMIAKTVDKITNHGIENQEVVDYEIPAWVYQKVFKYNKRSYIMKKNRYYHAMRRKN